MPPIAIQQLRRLKLVLTMAGLLLGLPESSVSSQSASSETLSNAAVIQMVMGKLPRDLVLTKIRSTGPAFDLTTQGLVQLTANKVPREVIETMMTVTQEAKANRQSANGAVGADEVVNNAGVVRMVAGSVTKSLIIAKIKSSRTAFDLSSGGLVWLHDNKVDSDIIKIMMAPPPPVAVAVPVREPLPAAAFRESPEDTRVQSTTSKATPSTAKSTSSITPAVSPVRTAKPVLATIPTEPGIHMRAADMSVKMLEPNDYSASKTSNMLGSALTYGLSKAKMKAVILNPEAAIQTTDSSVEFYFVFEASKASLGTAGQAYGVNLTSPNQFQLLRLDKRESRREVTTASFGAFSMQSGTDDKVSVPFTFVRLKTGVYRVMPKVPLTPGEYGFFPASMGGQGTAGAERLYDFGVLVP